MKLMEFGVDYEFCQGMHEDGEFSWSEFSYHGDGYDTLGKDFVVDPTTAVIVPQSNTPGFSRGMMFYHFFHFFSPISINFLT